MPAERPAPNPDSFTRGYRWREECARFLLGGALGALFAALTFLPVRGFERVGLDQSSAGALLSGVIYGPLGTLGYWIGESVTHFLGLGRWRGVESIVPWLLLGVAGHIAFRLRADTGRRLPNLRSYLVLLLAGAIAALPASIALVTSVFPAVTLRAVALWYAAALASILLIVPAALLLWPRALWRRRTPIAGELDPDSAPGRAPAPGSRVRGDSSGALAIPRPRRVLGDVAIVAGCVAAVHLLVVLAGDDRSSLNQWIYLLYSLPMLFASYRGGMKGGLLAGTLVGGSLLFSVVSGGAPSDWHLSAVDLQGGVVLFSLFGAVAGATRMHELELTARLQRSNRALRQDLERVLAALRSAMEAKDQYTEGHVRRVCDFALEVGRRMHLPAPDLELLEIASLLHDVGKIGIADTILRKPGPLDSHELEIMQRHPEIGARILENVDGLREAAIMVRHHQERYDGKTAGEFPGYPRGLAGEEIPFGARIIAVVDAFDAMTSDRPYRDAIGFEPARRALLEEAGKQFDPRVVELFLTLLAERGWESESATLAG